MADPRQSVFVEFSNYPQDAIGLYNELVNRQDHLRNALQARSVVKQKFVEACSSSQRAMLNSISEAVVWFLAVEFYSRFLSNPVKSNDSKRCLLTLIRALETPSCLAIEADYRSFLSKYAEIIKYIKVQRHQYLAHAAQVSWEKFPNVFDDEYKCLLDGVADILDSIASAMRLRLICSRSPSTGKELEI